MRHSFDNFFLHNMISNGNICFGLHCSKCQLSCKMNVMYYISSMLHSLVSQSHFHFLFTLISI
jgi:hypothetical protein